MSAARPANSAATRVYRKAIYLILAPHPAAAEYIDQSVFLWERLSASIVAAGKPLPQEKCQLAKRHSYVGLF
jgi:hypothetical protein